MTTWIVDASLEFIITREGKRYNVTCESDLGKREGFFEVDPSMESEIYKIQKATEEQRPLDEEFVEKLGIKLFEMLFSGSKDLLHTYLDQFDYLKIILNMKDPFLHEIPWELCYDSERNTYLGADSRCSLARRDQKSTRLFGKIDYPLKVLVIISSPMDLEEKREFQPDPDEIVELMNPVKDLEDKGMVKIDFLERASIKHIQDKLREGYHIVHFVGHGFYDGKTEKGYLVIEDKARNAKNLEGRGVAQLFGVNPPQLVILTACESSPLIPFLLSKKVPAILAMQYMVLKGLAYQFVERFYSLLVKGDSVMQAVSNARIVVQLEEGIGCTGWFTPVLYVRADDIIQVNTGSPVVIPEKKVQRHDMVIDLLGVENFVGRRKALWLIEKALLEDNLKVAVVTGIGGIGKTALVSKFVEKHKDTFRGVFARKIVDPEMGIGGILGLLDQFLMKQGDRRLHEVIGEADLTVKLTLLNDCLKDRYLIVLDNFEPLLKDERIVDNGVEAFLRAFLSGDHFSKIIITSRYGFTFRDEKAGSLVRYVDLKELSLQDVVHLLEKLGIEDHRIGRKVYKKIGGNPQILEFFAKLAKTRSAEGLLKDITPVREKIGEWFLYELVGLLTEDEQKVLKKLSAFRLKVDRSIFDVLNVSDKVVDKLVRHSLVKVEHGHCFMHKGVKQYVYVLLTDDEKVEAHAEVVKYYETVFKRKYRHVLLSHAEKVQAHAEAVKYETLSVKEEEDLQDISEFHYHLFESRQYERAGELVIDSVKPFLRQGSWGTLMALLIKTVKTTEGKTKAAGLHSLGIVFQFLGEYEKAEKQYKESLNIAEKLGDTQGIAASLYHLGIIYQLRGEYKEAEKFYRESLDIAKSLRDKQGTAVSLHQLGIIHEKWGEYKEAEKFYRESLDIAEKLGDKQGIAASLHQLGIIYQLQEKYKEAEKFYRESLDIKKSLGDKQGIAASLHQLGTIYEEQGNHKEAEKFYRESLDIKKSLGDKQGIARSFHQLGNLQYLQGNHKEAEKYYKKSLEIAEKLGDTQGIAQSFHQLGIIHQLRGEYKKAEKFYRESLDIKKSLRDKQGTARLLCQLGTLYEEQGIYRDALENYITSLAIFLQLGSPDAEDVFKNLLRMRQIIGEERFNDYWKTITW